MAQKMPQGTRALDKGKIEYFDSVEAAIAGDRPREIVREKVSREKLRQVKYWSKRGSLRVSAIREALGSGTWDSLMLDAMHKQLAKGWASVVEKFKWRQLVSMIRPVADFRTQYTLQIGSIGPVDKVPEKGAYHFDELTDDRSSYTVAKYGRLFGLSYESMTNDDLGAFSQIVRKLGAAAQATVEKFIFTTKLQGNPEIYDGNNLFDDSNHSNDLGTGYALNHDNYEAACEKLMTQTDIDGEPLEIMPRYLIVHPNQKYDALRVLRSSGRPDTGNNDVNVHEGEVELIVTPRITSTYWYVLADPQMVDTFEIGFLHGRQEPEIMEENRDSGSSFRYDERIWKLRHVFGGDWVDYRGVVRGYA